MWAVGSHHSKLLQVGECMWSVQYVLWQVLHAVLACGLCSLSRSRGSGGGGESGAAKGSDSGLAGSQRQGTEEEEVLSFALQAFETSLVPVFLVGVGDRGPRGFVSRSAQSGVTLACLHTPLPTTFHSLPLPPTQPLPLSLYIWHAKLQYAPSAWQQKALTVHLLQLGVDLLTTMADTPARRLAKNLGEQTASFGFTELSVGGVVRSTVSLMLHVPLVHCGFVQIALEGKKELGSHGSQRWACCVCYHGVTMMTFRLGCILLQLCR